MSDVDLYANVDRFQTDPDCTVIVVSLMKGGVGFTLTAASHMLVVELPWVPKDLSQAHGRAYGRVNDAHGLNAYHLLAPGTLDERVAEILERKLRVTTAVQDGEVLDEVEAGKSIVGELLEQLLADLKED
jgi:SNF2 family DNA or RNA helicase